MNTFHFFYYRTTPKCDAPHPCHAPPMHQCHARSSLPFNQNTNPAPPNLQTTNYMILLLFFDDILKKTGRLKKIQMLCIWTCWLKLSLLAVQHVFCLYPSQTVKKQFFFISLFFKVSIYIQNISFSCKNLKKKTNFPQERPAFGYISNGWVEDGKDHQHAQHVCPSLCCG